MYCNADYLWGESNETFYCVVPVFKLFSQQVQNIYMKQGVLETTLHYFQYLICFSFLVIKEGFLLGDVKGEAKNSITDSQMDDVEVVYTIGKLMACF